MKAPDVKYFEHIPVEPNRNLILARLGYRKGITAISEKDNMFIDAAVKRALLLCNARGAFCRSKINKRSANKVVLENGIELISEKLSAFLYHSSEVVFMSSTLGREISDTITGAMNNGNASSGLVFDAVASQVVDTALDWMMSFINKTIKIKGKALTKRRFSPGYGDLNLYHQKVIYDILDLKRIDISITEKFMLEPEKSVIAIAGIEVSYE
ncbi:MAG: Vitamin B12 dependent methionine synthase, activation domain [Pelotomaculum sp. PtaB.Bin013]|uniref:Methionine synthase n=1 Tax=Pelotomaculum isophthalicicum JI TaxID=947010 RepID=A0A9X4H6A9_9FIRM|nr:methionine synthase [Pelotomaculum isophthalicicum]MDF9409092.1 methionine synthase [Pelotomaculum isophthalicicum JI]OPX83882.1 MAG: Vitamin B12 dependent methionine synthase, activation domain [Pelotomaculum sp. PtaB.Bin013]